MKTPAKAKVSAMGNSLSDYSVPNDVVNNVRRFIVGGKRKRRNSDSDDEMSKVMDLALHTPKR